MIPMAVAVRGYAIPIQEQTEQTSATPKQRKRKGLRKPSERALIFDCETTTDHAQNLRFGTYQCRRDGGLIKQGIFYEPDDPMALSTRDVAVIRSYAAKHGLSCITRDEFIQNVFYRDAYAYGAAVVGFNLPFDISRLAIKYATAHARDMRGGFTFKLSNTPHHPNVVIKHLNSRTSFMRFAATGQFDSRSERRKGIKKQHRTGYFQNVKTLASALLGRGHTLKSLANTLGTEHRKLDPDGHNRPITPRYLDYAVTDTQVTWECYEKLLTIYEAHGLREMPAHRIYSEASLGKAYLNHMSILPLHRVQPEIPSELLGQIMGTYYGGRSEVRIRRRITRVLYCDFRSMYPTVCSLMGLWRFVIAKGFVWEDWTQEAQSLLEKIQLGDLQKNTFWPSLTALVQIEPSDDVLPLRAAYDGKSRTIGLNHLTTAGFPMWFTLADCVVSKILTGRVPKVVRATRFTPRGIQDGLKPLNIAGDHGLLLDPAKEDFFRELIVQRGKVQSALKRESNPHKRELLDAQQMMLKLLANSTSYGIYAEQNVQSYDRPRDLELYGQEDCFRIGSKSVEEPGTHFNPLIATLITGAARLMLACAESVAHDCGLGWAFCDTDSLALARPEGMNEPGFLNQCAKVTGWFDRLDPYGDGKPLFKVEEQNFRLSGGKLTEAHEPLYAIAISAKRYALFNLGKDGRPIIRKALAHGLGHLMEPYGEKGGPKSIPAPPQGLAGLDVKRWQYDLWYQIVLAFLEGHPDRIEFPKTGKLDRPARSRYGATTPALLNWFRSFNQGKAIHNQVKPFNFMLAYSASKTGFAAAIANGELDDSIIDHGLPAVAAPFSNTVDAAIKSFDRRTGKAVPSSVLKTYREAIADYAWHPESKFENGERESCGITRRRHIKAVAIEYIGKEANKWEEQFYLGELPEAAVEYGTSERGCNRMIAALSLVSKEVGQSALAEKAGITRQELSAILAKTAKPRQRTLRALMAAVMQIMEN